MAAFEIERGRLADLREGNHAQAKIAARAVAVLEAAAFAGTGAWERLLAEEQLAALESLLAEPTQLLDGLEQELFAPVESGLRQRAALRIEAVGHREASVAREAERLLHAAGESKAAYRVEWGRRNRRTKLTPSRDANRDSPGLVVVVAGGHARLRGLIRRDLTRSGVDDLREIPAAFEASRGGRDVAAKIGGADLAVLIVRQIAHSTSDQVTTAAAKLKVPVAFARTSGIGGVRREVEAFAATRRGTT